MYANIHSTLSILQRNKSNETEFIDKNVQLFTLKDAY